MTASEHQNDTVAPKLLAAIYSILPFVIVTVGARVWTRMQIIHYFGIDDVIMILCMTIFIAQSVMLTIAVHYGLGRHLLSGLNLQEIELAVKFLVISEYLYVFQTSLAKFSIGYSLIRLGVSKYLSCIIYSSFLVDIGMAVLALYSGFTVCKPIDYTWRVYGHFGYGTCRSLEGLKKTTYAWSSIIIGLDALFVALPAYMIWSLQLKRLVKIQVILLLSLGSVACVATIIRFKYVVSLTKTLDPLFTGAETVLWSIVECGIGIICSSLATLRPLLHYMITLTSFKTTGSGEKLPYRSGLSQQIRCDDNELARLESDLSVINERIENDRN